MKVAYFSPLPPSTSGIADYSALLLPALEQLVEVEVVRPGRTRPVADADVALYHVGNDPDAHGWIVDALKRRPGVVVLHDFVIHHLVAGLTIGRHDGHAYLAAMEREAGVPGRLLGYGVLEGRVPPLWEVRPQEFPLAGEVLDRATSVIVHSRYVETLVREHGYDGPLHRVPHPAWPVPDAPPAAVEGSPLLGSFGHINENKRVPQLLQAFAALRRTRHGARLLLVGSEAPGFDLAGRIERTGLDAGGLVREPYVEEERLWSLMAACDAIVLLRAPTMGETSGAAIRALSLGKPLVVSDVGWFAELPDEVAIKIPVGGEEEVAALTAALRRVADPEAARALGTAAKALVEREHGVGRVADMYVAALEEAAGGGMVREAVLHEVATAAADIGIEPEPFADELVHSSLISRDGPVQVTVTGRSPLRTLPVWAWLGALYAAATTIQLALALRVTSPWIMVDEIVYSDMARSFARTGHFLIRGVHGNYGFVYPLLLSPVYRAIGPMTDVYRWSQAVNALVVCTAVVPAYLLARRVVRPHAALVAAALTVAVPSTVYAGTIMTENVFYPVFLWLAFALVATLDRPTRMRQSLLLVACALAFVTRAQTVAIVVAVLTAPLLLAWIERGRPQRLKAFAPLYGIVAGVAVIVVIAEAARGRSPAAILGNYSVTSNGGYRVWPVIEWVVLHLAELDLAVFVLPFAAFVVLAANARHLDRGLRVFVAACVSLGIWLTLEVGAFASQYSQRLEERNLFYLMPLLLIALVAWIERGQPLPPRASVAAAGLAAALPGVIPFAHLFNITAESDTIGLQPWWFLGNTWTGRHGVGVAAVALSLALAACFLWLPRRYAPVLPALVAAGFLLTWLPVELWTHSFPRLASSAYAQGSGKKDKSWIDDAVGRDAHVAVVFAGGNQLSVFENEFWNRSIDRVYGLGARLPGDMPEDQTHVDATTGDLVGVTERYVLAPSSLQLVGTPLARDPAKQLVLYRTAQPVRITTRVVGLFPTTPGTEAWSRGRVSWTRTRCTGGTLAVKVSSDANLFEGTVSTIAVSGTTSARTLTIPPTTVDRPITLHLTPQNGVCRVDFAITPTRAPVKYEHGATDTRRLGLHFTPFTYTP